MVGSQALGKAFFFSFSLLLSFFFPVVVQDGNQQRFLYPRVIEGLCAMGPSLVKLMNRIILSTKN